MGHLVFHDFFTHFASKILLFFLVLDDKLFIFKLAVKQTDETFKTGYRKASISCWLLNGPTFSFMTDDKGMDPPREKFADVLKISCKPNVNKCSCDRLDGFAIEGGSKITNETLAGRSRFCLKRMEVFQITE